MISKIKLPLKSKNNWKKLKKKTPMLLMLTLRTHWMKPLNLLKMVILLMLKNLCNLQLKKSKSRKENWNTARSWLKGKKRNWRKLRNWWKMEKWKKPWTFWTRCRKTLRAKKKLEWAKKSRNKLRKALMPWPRGTMKPPQRPWIRSRRTPRKEKKRLKKRKDKKRKRKKKDRLLNNKSNSPSLKSLPSKSTPYWMPFKKA